MMDSDSTDDEFYETCLNYVVDDKYISDYYEETAKFLEIKNTNYENSSFCYGCCNRLTIPENNINEFVINHLDFGCNKKYLLLIFIVEPTIFCGKNIFLNKHICKYIKNRLDIYDVTITSEIFIDYLTKIQSSMVTNENIYDILFYQKNLTFVDYVKCDICKKFLCPMHIYLSAGYYSKCNKCPKYWSICGWCKPVFYENIACKIYHK